uniref:NADH dehydrogenase subunit 4L n=1 Tax=Lophops carinata TaxID=130616 RepID=A0A7M1IBY4_9HEMI|nr:NADH dehydrogenase subunit 4L [Lophops carinata]QOQ36887.1 NADH dehydrogenase subunit 4L [Lophops carinata]
MYLSNFMFFFSFLKLILVRKHFLLSLLMLEFLVFVKFFFFFFLFSILFMIIIFLIYLFFLGYLWKLLDSFFNCFLSAKSWSILFMVLV